jgi:hypothetical protein
MRNFGDFLNYSNIDIGCPLWTFILNGPRIWHVVQSKSITWHINYILTKIQVNIYLNKYTSKKPFFFNQNIFN